jgi:hypothetical protein
VRDVLTRPVSTLGSLGRGSLVRAAIWAGLVYGAVGASVGAMIGAMAVFGLAGWQTPLPGLDGALAAFALVVAITLPFLYAVSGEMLVLLGGGLFHLCAAGLGGKARLDESMRAVAYSTTIQLLAIPTAVVSLVPVIGNAVALAVIGAQAVWAAFALAAFARGPHALSQGRAWAAALIPIGGALAAAALVVAVAWMASEPPARSPDLYLEAPSIEPEPIRW